MTTACISTFVFRSIEPWQAIPGIYLSRQNTFFSELNILTSLSTSDHDNQSIGLPCRLWLLLQRLLPINWLHYLWLAVSTAVYIARETCQQKRTILVWQITTWRISQKIIEPSSTWLMRKWTTCSAPSSTRCLFRNQKHQCMIFHQNRNLHEDHHSPRKTSTKGRSFPEVHAAI